MPYEEKSHWEYLVDEIDGTNFERQLNRHGSSNWELVAICGNSIIFKRQVIEVSKY